MWGKITRNSREKSKVSWDNIKNDKASDMMKHYGWSEREMHQQIRNKCDDASQAELNKVDHEMYRKKG